MDSFIAWWESGIVTHLFFSIEVIRDSFSIILRAFPVSLFLGAGAFVLAVLPGLALALMKMSKQRWLRWPATAYVDVVRGTPLFLQILIIFLGLPILPFYRAIVVGNPWMKEAFYLPGLDFTLIARALFVLLFNSAAYMAEIFRAGIQSIPRGQMEAARSLGMTAAQSMGFIIIPQTVRRILPTMMSEFILLFKDTALLAAMSVPEMTQKARAVASTTFNMSAYMLAAAFYLAVTIPLGRVVAALEDRLAEAEGGGSRGKRPPLTGGNIDSEHVVAHSNRVMDIAD